MKIAEVPDGIVGPQQVLMCILLHIWFKCFSASFCHSFKYQWHKVE